MKFSEFIKSKNVIGGFIVFLAGELFSYIVFCDEVLSTNFAFSLSLKQILAIVILLAFLAYVCCCYLLFLKKSINEERQRNEYLQRINEDIKIGIEKSEGQKVFALAMALNIYEPSRIDLLKKAAFEYHYPYAGLYLGNLYSSGLMNGDIVIIEKDYQKAADSYISVKDTDETGNAYWQIGWLYEKERIGQNISELKREVLALKYYHESAKYGYAKAYNSLGKFYEKGKGGLNKDRFKAISFFSKAVEAGDSVCAILNEAYIHSEEESEYVKAVECFKTACANNNPLAFLKYAQFIENNMDRLAAQGMRFTVESVFELYKKAAMLVRTPIAARAYFAIGQLSVNNCDFDPNNHWKGLFSSKPQQFVIACNKKAKVIFDECIARNVQLSDTDEAVMNMLP